ncbi:MAG: hypothetical protein LBL95_02350 [Deltaproteobacteria bacterium]|jgi:TPR repeat protein|nr:hypothetical protein [Deltaproteobacteria bacterium]
MYEDGEVVERDLAETVRWLKKSVEQLPPGLVTLGTTPTGEALAKDLGATRMPFERAAELAAMARPGPAGPPLPQQGYAIQGSGQGHRLSVVASRLDDTEAMTLLGLLHSDGGDLPRDTAKAVHWFPLGSRSGHQRAQGPRHCPGLLRAAESDNISSMNTLGAIYYTENLNNLPNEPSIGLKYLHGERPCQASSCWPS